MITYINNVITKIKNVITITKQTRLQIRIKSLDKELLKAQAEDLGLSLSAYVREASQNYNKLKRGYKQFNSLFKELSELANVVLDNKKLFRELVQKNIDINLIEQINKVLEVDEE